MHRKGSKNLARGYKVKEEGTNEKRRTNIAKKETGRKKTYNSPKSPNKKKTNRRD